MQGGGSARSPAASAMGLPWDLNRRMTRSVPPLLLQRLDRDFLEIDNVVACLVLQADVAFVRTAAGVGFVREFPGMGGLAFGVVGYLDTVQHDDGPRAVERDVHGVPFRTRLARKSQWLGE